MSISAGVVIAVTFEKIDYAPNSETCTESDYESLKNANCRSEKCHRLNCQTQRRGTNTAQTTGFVAWHSFQKIFFDLIFEGGRFVLVVLSMIKTAVKRLLTYRTHLLQILRKRRLVWFWAAWRGTFQYRSNSSGLHRRGTCSSGAWLYQTCST